MSWRVGYLAYIPSVQVLFGVPANLLLLYLTLFRTPKSFRNYARIIMIGGVCDLIGAMMQPILVARSVTLSGVTILQFHGFCTLHSVELCWAAMGILETLLAINDSLICTSLYFRLLTIMDKTPSDKITIVYIFIIIIPNLPLSFGYYAAMRKFRGFSGDSAEISLRELLNKSDFHGVINLSDPLSIVIVVWTCASSSIFFNSALYIRWKLIQLLEKSKCSMSTSSRRLHLMFVKTLNVQLLILICFLTGSIIYILDAFQITHSIILQFAILPIISLQFTLAPIANIYFIKPYRMSVTRIFHCANTEPIVSSVKSVSSRVQ